MHRNVLSLLLLASQVLLCQTVNVKSPNQGRPAEVVPWTRFHRRAEAYTPTGAEIQQIQAKIDSLSALISTLESRKTDDALLADIEIFREAARWILTFPEEFFNKDSVPATLQVLDMGIERGMQLKQGKAPWTTQKGRLLRGFRSALDGSVQPYRLTVPEEYDGSRPFPLDVAQHGRAVTTYEVNFINNFARRGAETKYLPGTIQMEIFGRGNNAYHWPGEADIFEAIAAVKKAYKVDPERMLLRGFSMGGAGVWHTAPHYPDLWASIETGAGDNQSHRIPILSTLAPHQQAMCTILDNMFAWVLNIYNTPFIDYVGEIDGSFSKQVLARQQLAREGFHFEGESFTTGLRVAEIPNAVFFVAPNTPHAMHPEIRKRMDAIHYENIRRGRQIPDHIRFLTYTTRYNRSYWVTLDGLARHYERAEIDARRNSDRSQYTVTTKNLTRLLLRETDHAAVIDIDGQKVNVQAAPAIALEKSAGIWRQASLQEGTGLRKRHGLQGPIDDAFLEPFLVVRPTGLAWNPGANRQALRILEKFDRQYKLAYRGHIRVKDDKDVTESDLQKYNIILFGDPGSNRWISRLNGKLPVGWTRQDVTVGSRTFSALDSLPAFIYPNPLNPSRYVVINSGLTAEWDDWAGDFPAPQYGDVAILRADEKDIPDVAFAGLFDEFWRLP